MDESCTARECIVLVVIAILSLLKLVAGDNVEMPATVVVLGGQDRAMEKEVASGS